MPRNGSGVYGPPAGTAAVPNTTIESADYNSVVADLSQALTDSINVAGTAPFQGNQSMGDNKLVNLAAGSAAGDSINLGQVQSGIVAHAVTMGGTADAIVLTFSPPFSAYVAKMRFRFTASLANALAAPTINIDGLGLKTIKKLNGLALEPGDIAGAGHICECVYDGTDVVLLNPALPPDKARTYTTKQTFNGPVVHGTTTLPDPSPASTIAWSLATGGPNYRIVLPANRTLGTFTGGTVGQEGFLTVAEDGTGGWSLDLNDPVYDWYGGFVENIARGVNDETVFFYRVLSSGSMFLKRMGATSIGGPGKDLLETKTASNSATIDFVLTKWLQLYDRFEIDLEDILPATNATDLYMRTSSNGGSSYDNGASDYAYATLRVRGGGGTVQGASSDADTKIILNDLALSNVAGESLAGKLIVHNPRASARCKVSWDLFHFTDDTGFVLARLVGGGARMATADVDAIRFLASSGNHSGTYRLYGIRK
jgi:hypothetical protein